MSLLLVLSQDDAEKESRQVMRDTNRPRRDIKIRLRPALAVAVACLLVLRPLTPPGRASADGSLVDLTSTKLQTTWSFPDRDTGKTDADSTLAITGMPISQADKDALAPLVLLPIIPLGAAFDQLWSQTPDKTGKTTLDKSCALAQKQVVAQVNSGSYKAHDVSCSFMPTGGTVDGRVQTQWDGPEDPRTLQPTTIIGNRLQVDYTVHHNSVTFSVTSPVTGGVSPLSDAQFTATFDITLTLYAVTSDSTCTLKPTALGTLLNPNITPDNAEAQFAMSNIPDVQSVIGVATSVMNNETFPVDTTSSNSQLGPLTQIWAAACNLGFPQVTATIDSTKGLSLVFTHPLADAPLTFQQVGSLFGATIQPDQSAQVRAGDPITIDGTYFSYYPSNSGSATSLTFAWTDTAPAAQIVESDVNWGPQGGATQTVTLPRKPNDHQNSYLATNLNPNAPYQFQVRDCDPVTCSKWSSWQTWSTGVQGSNTVQFWLDSDSGTKIGQATVAPGGTFSSPLTIPAGTASGSHTLNAQTAASGGQPTTTTITVLGAGQRRQPEIAIVDPNTGHPVQGSARVTSGNSFTLNGDGFGAGRNITVYLDSAGGQVVGTTQAASDGTFQTQLTMPYPQSGGYGNHKIVAAESGSGQSPPQATIDVYIDAAAQ
jgi:hypothetical protein